ncbi:Uncharacterised protein [Halioglobus japonicus]|nr:Uncharacterised protein [Halioglobus japonicus]
MKSTRYYNKNAAALATQYDAIASGDIHDIWKDHLPERNGLACDIGAGTGRDANWLASKGWDVIAVEPSSAMREHGMSRSRPGVTWLDDSLPRLDKLRALGYRFNLILLSAVWMHIPESKRERAFRILSEMLAPSGVLVISLRYGTDAQENTERVFYEVTASELLEYAKKRSIAVASQYRHADLNRAHVSWETMVFHMPA